MYGTDTAQSASFRSIVILGNSEQFRYNQIIIRDDSICTVPHLAPKSLVLIRRGTKLTKGPVVLGDSVISANAFDILLEATFK